MPLPAGRFNQYDINQTTDVQITAIERIDPGSGVSLDALIPAEMASKAEQIGVKKARMSALSMFVLAVLAGAFIALGAVFSTNVVVGSQLCPTASCGCWRGWCSRWA